MQWLPSHVHKRNIHSALAAAFYIISGCRVMERGTISSVRDANATTYCRLELPFGISSRYLRFQTKFVLDRLTGFIKPRVWLWLKIR
jgi:tryptophanase